MPINGNYISEVGVLENHRWKIRMFYFISTVGGYGATQDVAVHSAKFISCEGDSEIDFFDFNLRANRVTVKFQQIPLSMGGDLNLWGHIRSGTGVGSQTVAAFHSTDKNFYLEIYRKSDGETIYFRFKRGSERYERTPKGESISMTFTDGFDELDQIKQWNQAGTSRNSTWTNIFSGNKVFLTYLADMMDPKWNESKLGGRSGFVQDNNKYYRDGTNWVDISGVYLKSTDFSNGTSVNDSSYKTVADAIKDVSRFMNMVVFSNGLNQIRVVKAPKFTDNTYRVELDKEDLEGSITESMVWPQLEGMAWSVYDNSSPKVFSFYTLGNVYLKDNRIYDTKNSREQSSGWYFKKTGLTPQNKLYLTGSLYDCVSIHNGYVMVFDPAEFMSKNGPAYATIGSAWRVVRFSGIKVPTFKPSKVLTFLSSHYIAGNEVFLTRIQRDYVRCIDTIDGIYGW